MMMRFKLEGVPDDLAPGDYATKVVSAKWEGSDIVVTLKYTGPVEKGERICLFRITKHSPDDLVGKEVML